VKIKPITYQDETKFQLQVTQNNLNAVDELLAACTECDWKSLYMFDKNYLLFKLREISYGNEYSVVGSCTSCSKETQLNLKLSDLPIKPYEGDGTIELTLPDSAVTAKVRIPNITDQKFLDTLESASKSLWRFVVTLNGTTDTDIIQSFLEKTTLRDVSRIREAVYELDYGLESTCWFKCQHCNADSKTTVPINETFFTVS
jgi:hypothetical protein